MAVKVNRVDDRRRADTFFLARRLQKSDFLGVPQLDFAVFRHGYELPLGIIKIQADNFCFMGIKKSVAKQSSSI